MEGLGLKGRVLVSRDVSPWLPFVAPDIKKVMPQHTYPIMLQTILPPVEYKERMLLTQCIQKKTISLSRCEELLCKYDVEALVTPIEVKILPISSSRIEVVKRVLGSKHLITVLKNK